MAVSADPIRAVETAEFYTNEPKEIRHRTIQEVFDSITQKRVMLDRLAAEMRFVTQINPLRQIAGDQPVEIFNSQPAFNLSFLSREGFNLAYRGLHQFIEECQRLREKNSHNLNTLDSLAKRDPQLANDLENRLKASLEMIEKKGESFEALINELLTAIASKVGNLSLLKSAGEWKKMERTAAKHAPHAFSADFVRRCKVMI